jgi:hypothetical protein
MSEGTLAESSYKNMGQKKMGLKFSITLISSAIYGIKIATELNILMQ